MTLIGAVAFNPIPSLAGHDNPPPIPTLSLPNPPMEEHVQATVLPSHGDPPVLFGGHRRRTLAADAPLDAPPPLSPPKPISKSPVMTVPAALPYGWSPSLPSPYPSCVCPPPSPIPPPPPRDCTLPPVDPLQAVFTDVLCLLQQLNQVDWAAVPTNVCGVGLQGCLVGLWVIMCRGLLALSTCVFNLCFLPTHRRQLHTCTSVQQPTHWQPISSPASIRLDLTTEHTHVDTWQAVHIVAG